MGDYDGSDSVETDREASEKPPAEQRNSVAVEGVLLFLPAAQQAT